MWTPLGTLVFRYRTLLAACQRPFAVGCALVVATLGAVHPVTAEGQRADGAIGVSLIIVPPAAARPVTITGIRIDRAGMATIRTTSSAASRTTALVLARVSRSASDLAAGRYALAPPCDLPRAECEREIEFRVDVGRKEPGAARRDVRLRMELLVVAGT
jgi:hypothetical protein